MGLHDEGDCGVLCANRIAQKLPAMPGSDKLHMEDIATLMNGGCAPASRPRGAPANGASKASPGRQQSDPAAYRVQHNRHERCLREAEKEEQDVDGGERDTCLLDIPPHEEVLRCTLLTIDTSASSRY
jgi:hypothetical protein